MSDTFINESLRRIHRVQGWLEVLSREGEYSLANMTPAQRERLFTALGALQRTVATALTIREEH